VYEEIYGNGQFNLEKVAEILGSIADSDRDFMMANIFK
jgi:hypothetical protein